MSKKAKITLWGDRITVDLGTETMEMAFDDIKVAAVLGKNKLNLYHKDQVFQVKGDKRYNPLRYMNTYYHAKNLKGGHENDGFLGI